MNIHTRFRVSTPIKTLLCIKSQAHSRLLQIHDFEAVETVQGSNGLELCMISGRYLFYL
ncbi:hypothetical protein E4T56_gene9171, partial [Termitomyces sp. T112]